MLLLLSASTLSASHVHVHADFDLHEQVESCDAYHVVDHLKTAVAPTLYFDALPAEDVASIILGFNSASDLYLPPSRAPPVYS